MGHWHKIPSNPNDYASWPVWEVAYSPPAYASSNVSRYFVHLVNLHAGLPKAQFAPADPHVNTKKGVIKSGGAQSTSKLQDHSATRPKCPSPLQHVILPQSTSTAVDQEESAQDSEIDRKTKRSKSKKETLDVCDKAYEVMKKVLNCEGVPKKEVLSKGGFISFILCFQRANLSFH